jgi:hypothetical protein
MGTLEGFPDAPATGLRRRSRPWAGLILAVLLALTAVGISGCRRSRLRPGGDGAAVVVLEQGGAPAAQLGEHEPNNTVATAQPLSLTGDPLAVSLDGTLPGTGKSADVDVFRLTVPGGTDAAAPDGAALGARRLIVEVHPAAESAVVLQLLDAAGRPVLTTSGSPGEPDGLPNVAVAPGGTYYLRLRAVDRPLHGPPDAGSPPPPHYQLLSRVIDFELGEEREPNDRPAQATDLGPAARNPEAAGFYGWRKDEDWYRLSLDGLPAGSVLDLELDPVDGVVGGVAVHDGAGIRLAGTRGRRGERAVLRNVAVPAPPTSGPGEGRAVYAVVRTEGGRNIDHRYALHVRAGLAQEGAETEPNDDPAHASAAGEGLTTGFLGPGDVDVYRFAPALPGTVDVEVTPAEGSRVKLEVLRQRDGQPLGSSASAGRGQPERVASVPAAEPILLRVTGRRGEGNPDEPYQLRIQSRAAAPAPPGAPP